MDDGSRESVEGLALAADHGFPHTAVFREITHRIKLDNQVSRRRRSRRELGACSSFTNKNGLHKVEGQRMKCRERAAASSQ
eukprot:2891500-Rhodomonas_salina.3